MSLSMFHFGERLGYYSQKDKLGNESGDHKQISAYQISRG